MVDEALRAAARDPHATPLERMRQALVAAHSHDGGLVFCENDEEINEAARQSRRIATKLYAGDVILVTHRSPSKYDMAEPWLATVVATQWDEQRWREKLKIEHEIAVVAVFDILGQKPGPDVNASRSGCGYAGLKWISSEYSISVLMRGGAIA